MKKFKKPTCQTMKSMFNKQPADSRKWIVEHIKKNVKFKTIKRFLKRYPEYLEDFL